MAEGLDGYSRFFLLKELLQLLQALLPERILRFLPPPQPQHLPPRMGRRVENTRLTASLPRLPHLGSDLSTPPPLCGCAHQR